MTTLPDHAQAEALAQGLVESRLAACVHIGAPLQSIYRWDGAITSATEIPLHIKTTTARYAAVETFITQHHPYSMPEIIALDITRGASAYRNWVGDETQAELRHTSPSETQL